MKTTLRMQTDSPARCLTVILDPGESLAGALVDTFVSRHINEISELVLVADPFDDDPLAGCDAVRARIARGDLVLTLRSRAEQEDVEVDAFVQRIHGARRIPGPSALPKTPRIRPPHPDAASLRSPPISGSDRLSRLTEQGRRGPASPPPTKPTGPLAPYLGAQHELDALLTETEGPEEAACVLAWPVPALVGRAIVAPDFEGLAGAIRAVLFEALGDLPIAVDGSGYGGLGKYMHLHTSVLAPPMGDEPMALELYGRLVAVGDYDFRTREAGRYLLHREREMHSLHPADPPTDAAHLRMMDLIHGRDFPGPLVVVLSAATYANVRFPGVGVPFYM
ncbi:hypothetical protein [Polyangium jinanense]|uniref:Uncharacterized protein n=1 Tax=Polyangium jinanense TaxID=2829994 RepID=A0A9X3X5E3_9BACT|nr:hypothetical protein [Polyangium jinanense]MDC3957606.1 hypothetical protein [Polyangium jinanense]MDC3984612.1 hypothetical protein [Polyangium jinanense]